MCQKVKILNTQLIVLLLIVAASLQAQVRVKEAGRLLGVEGMSLIGYGLVVGLNRSGDSPKSLFTNQALTNMLERFGIAVEGDKVRSKNVAAVIVTAEVPPYCRTGSRFDITVSSLGDAKSLQGGVLLQTTLTDLNGDVWGIASGPIAIGGFSVETEQISLRENHPVVGRIPDGGVLKRNLEIGVDDFTSLTIMLNATDFTSAYNMSLAINSNFEEEIASAVDGKSVIIKVPENYADPTKIVNFIAQIENVHFAPDVTGRVVINERTGTVIIGSNVSLSPVAISHGALSITVKSTPVISQAQPFAPGGETLSEEMSEVSVEQRDTGMVAMPGAGTVGDVASALNKLGVNPRDIIAIFQALKQAGALNAELVII
ncbi:flagellar basal body P-ring protein FlgI [bacterium]|nr:flagellar basal body P-ring protein FlgI [bacterium]